MFFKVISIQVQCGCPTNDLTVKERGEGNERPANYLHH